MTMSHIEAVAAQSRSNPGEILRQAREEKGWQVAEVAAQLNLTAHSLAQLEAGEFDRLPGHTFARGYVRAYAKLLGLDQAELVGIFDRYTGTDATGSTVHSLGHVPEPLRLSRTVLRLASAVLLLLLLLLGYFWWQERPERLAELGVFGLKHIEVESADGTTELHPLDELEDQAVAEALQGGEPAAVESLSAAQPSLTGAEAAVPAQPDEAASAPAAEPAPTQPAVSAPAAAVPAPAAPAAAAPAVVPPAAPLAAAPVLPAIPATPAPSAADPVSATPAVAEAAAPAPAPQVAAGEGLVQLSFSADCWTQVTDGNGRVLVSTVKHAGESLQIAGKTPLELRLGNARVAQVRYNGEPVEHRKNMTASGTARVKLGQ